VVVDALGQELQFSLPPGQRNDTTQASALLQGFERANIIADKGYNANALVEQIQGQKSLLSLIKKHFESMTNISIKMPSCGALY
jgi:hypothetical protein